MPYELTFSKTLPELDLDLYWNECCVGGDLVVDRVLPAVQARYTDVQSNQEDWGWFIWFQDGPIRLAFDVFTDDPKKGLFRAHVTSSTKKLFSQRVVDTPELEMLKDLLRSELESWVEGALTIRKVDDKYL